MHCILGIGFYVPYLNMSASACIHTFVLHIGAASTSPKCQLYYQVPVLVKFASGSTSVVPFLKSRGSEQSQLSIHIDKGLLKGGLRNAFAMSKLDKFPAACYELFLLCGSKRR